MTNFFKPDFTDPSVTAVTPELLAELGVKTFSLDVDGSIMSHHATEIPPEILEHLQTIGRSGVRIAFSSNAYGERVEELHVIAATIGDDVKVVTPASVSPSERTAKRYRKPHPAMIEEVAKQTGAGVAEVLHGGDQALKDVAAANRAGAKSLLIPRYGMGGDWRVECFQRPIEGLVLPFLGVKSLRRQIAMKSI